ncbi:MAG: hypothetical protein KZQ65_12715, partial [Candidatus Thiodiazotropha sp. (ex Gloverina cf. vestifex)]|nr:hypothetical protein [Candidatus Thiodiazotropha sp. (ex Gloverina cf. vestifex)]
MADKLLKQYFYQYVPYRTIHINQFVLYLAAQACRYLVKDFGTSESPKSTRQRDSRYAPTV